MESENIYKSLAGKEGNEKVLVAMKEGTSIYPEEWLIGG